MPCSCSPKAKAIQSRVRQQINCPSFGNKGTLSLLPTEQATFVIYTVSIKYGVRTTDCGLGTADWRLRTTNYGLDIKHGLRSKTRTKHYGLGMKHGLRYKTRTAD